jgi:hypothetical protein
VEKKRRSLSDRYVSPPQRPNPISVDCHINYWCYPTPPAGIIIVVASQCRRSANGKDIFPRGNKTREEKKIETFI